MGKSSRKPGSKAAVAHSKQQKTVIQKIAVNNAVKHFKSNARALITMACGSGKTRVGFMTIERMKKTISIIAVPTLGLVKQMRDDAAAWLEFSKHSQLLVCSSIRHGDVHERPEDYGLSVTTSPDVILETMQNASARSKLLIVVTYQSFDKIAAAMKLAKKRKLNIELGLLVCDEAHNTAGDKSKKMSLCLSDKVAKISKRLFLTATPRVIGDRTKNPEKHNCMDDVKVYGKNVYSLSFAEAIQQGITCDYEIRNMEVNWKGDAAKKLNSRSFQKSSSRVNELARYLAREMKKRPGMRVFSFHTDCASAEAFNAALVKCGVWSRCITGEMPVNEREVILGEFEANGKSRVICSVRVFGEGVDVPSVDTVVFTDPLTSEIQIAQMVGRGQRIEEGKNLLSVYLPIFHPMGATSEVAEKTAKCSYFRTAIKVLRTMSSFDDRVVGEIRSKAEGNYSDDKTTSRSIFNQDGMSAEFAKVVNSLLLAKVDLIDCMKDSEIISAMLQAFPVRPRVNPELCRIIVCGKSIEAWKPVLLKRFGMTLAEFLDEIFPSTAKSFPDSRQQVVAIFRKHSKIKPDEFESCSAYKIGGRSYQMWHKYILSRNLAESITTVINEAWIGLVNPRTVSDMQELFRDEVKEIPERLCDLPLIGGRTWRQWQGYIEKKKIGVSLSGIINSLFPDSNPDSLDAVVAMFRTASAKRISRKNKSMVFCGKTLYRWNVYLSQFGVTLADAFDMAWPESAVFNPNSIKEVVTRLRKDHKHRPSFGEAPCGLTAGKWEAIAKRLKTTVAAIMNRAWPDA